MANFKMSDEQTALFNLLTPLQREIALNSVSGMNDIDAYKNSKGKCKALRSMESAVSRLLSNVKVVAFLESVRGESVNKAIMGRDEMMERLTVIARTSISDVVTFSEGGEGSECIDSDGAVVQSAWSIKDSAKSDPLKMASISEVTASKDGLKIKQHSPLAAMKQIADLGGYNKASKIDHQSSDGSMSPKKMTDEEFAEKMAAYGIDIK